MIPAANKCHLALAIVTKCEVVCVVRFIL